MNCTFVEPVQVQAGASAAVAVISGLEKKVEFTASENGWYAFTFDKDTVKVSYTKGQYMQNPCTNQALSFMSRKAVR